ncbi:hypothetical protein CC1G_00185 [Coprinopsis cinerea okayama7|uniref:BTB domain-containing protein n=1 Tax=Coprinopsis cinerea (strain Okayama-7 / 130 / ATCC MYA-4618 / FGSC 9003) TaxID=240176 RepID=A8NX27_COPC7|nr:hypothetical protein CC1G_00185 [Coprinopsis cinerea okayama7\|eukprot:XP_001837049.2 hypothetical protein CC1G_00185 [Coprinopsis cinerea okayama7\
MSTPVSQSNWDPRASSSGPSASGNVPMAPLTTWRANYTPRAGAHAIGSNGPLRQEAVETTRQWSLTGFEWAVKDIAKLRNFVEGSPTGTDQPQLSADDFEILKESPTLADSKFKLEIGMSVTIAFESRDNTFLSSDHPWRRAWKGTPVSVYYFSVLRLRVGRLGNIGHDDGGHQMPGRQNRSKRCSPRMECPLPSLSDLLRNERIRETDSFVICLQIHSPSGPSIPQQPATCYVPRDLLDGLEASLDNPITDTGDVKFICLERLVEGDEPPLSASTSSMSRQTSSSLGSPRHPFSSQATARKRVIYAHSDILVRRSEYFATMLSSSFSETSSTVPGERKIHTIVVEEADFETIYWLLKFCYANWLLFKQNDDPRAAVEGVGAGWSAKWLTSPENEWEWKTFYKSAAEDNVFDARSATSGDSIPASGISRSTSKKSDIPEDVPPQTSGQSVSTRPAGTSSKAPPTVARPATSGARRSTTNTSTLGPGASMSGTSRPKTVPIATSGFATSRAYPVSPRAARPLPPPVPDPHPHPTPPPPPASALAMYQVAHRYAMNGLATLALEHIMSTITPQSCFPLLLASYTWDELYGLVEWDEVAGSDEFEQCCKEIAAGEWGSDGGQTLMSVFRRLRSPSTLTN